MNFLPNWVCIQSVGMTPDRCLLCMNSDYTIRSTKAVQTLANQSVYLGWALHWRLRISERLMSLLSPFSASSAYDGQAKKEYVASKGPMSWSATSKKEIRMRGTINWKETVYMEVEEGEKGMGGKRHDLCLKDWGGVCWGYRAKEELKS